jgi:replicative DNA helicase
MDYLEAHTLDEYQHHHANSTLGELTSCFWEAVEQRGTPVPTGIACLDTALGGGLVPGRLLGLLGGPGSGKTALANQLAETVASTAHPVVYLTLEETGMTLLAKTMSRVGNLDYGTVLHTPEQVRDRIDQTFKELNERESSRYLLYCEDDGRTTLQTVRRVVESHFGHWPETSGLLVVDYLQHWARTTRGMAHSGVRDLREVVSSLADDLHHLAIELNCAVLMLASQNRASGYNGEHTIASAKESGDIEYACDVMMSITPNNKDKGTISPGWQACTLHIAKNRLGATGTHALKWRGSRQEFQDAHAAAASGAPARPTHVDDDATTRWENRSEQRRKCTVSQKRQRAILEALHTKGTLTDDDLYEASGLEFEGYDPIIQFLLTHDLISSSGQAPRQRFTISSEGLAALRPKLKDVA